ncbi:hypothetical protein BRO54_3154 [Geobacillus proteiniphilus]|uniref:Uncharacterized protein n=1 Tax=Geobacillus proteiniphilus TaxID=860353 RepID=A0A1Q5SQ40_9BACL|nr:hypothetical protein BRO54_3154 [Geobacillus proteiniphilus]
MLDTFFRTKLVKIVDTTIFSNRKWLVCYTKIKDIFPYW